MLSLECLDIILRHSMRYEEGKQKAVDAIYMTSHSIRVVFLFVGADGG